MEKIIFRKMEISDKAKFDNYLTNGADVYKNYFASELNFSNIFCWSDAENLKIAEHKNGIIMLANYENNEFFLPPLCNSNDEFLSIIKDMAKISKDRKAQFVVKCLNMDMVNLVLKEFDKMKLKVSVFGDYAPQVGKNRQLEIAETHKLEDSDFQFVYNENSAEYLYDTQKMITFEGKKLHSKRNHLNSFVSKYDYSLLPYDNSLKQELLQFCKEKNTSEFEMLALTKCIENYIDLQIKGYVLKVDSKIVAFSFGFISKTNVGIFMFEKADFGINGSGVAVFNFAVKQGYSNCAFINRQEDMGIEGLRKSKLSYQPIAYAEKFNMFECCNYSL